MFLAALTHSLTHTLTRTNLQPRWPTKGSSVVGGIEAQYGKAEKCSIKSVCVDKKGEVMIFE